jgi:hypothetical protein
VIFTSRVIFFIDALNLFVMDFNDFSFPFSIFLINFGKLDHHHFLVFDFANFNLLEAFKLYLLALTHISNSQFLNPPTPPPSVLGLCTPLFRLHHHQSLSALQRLVAPCSQRICQLALQYRHRTIFYPGLILLHYLGLMLRTGVLQLACKNYCFCL